MNIKIIRIASDGSCFVDVVIKIKQKIKVFEAVKKDDINALFNQKIIKSYIDSKSSVAYKIRYFNRDKWNIAKWQGNRFWYGHSKVRILLFQ